MPRFAAVTTLLLAAVMAAGAGALWYGGWVPDLRFPEAASAPSPTQSPEQMQPVERAALAIRATPTGLRIGLTGKFFGVALALAVLLRVGRRHMSEDELQDWLWESWRFVKQIFPLLVVGVFIVGMIRVIIRPEWIELLAGTNSLTGNLAGVVFGVFMYFPTLVEVPIAKMFLELGMHRGPLLAYLMSDPELSLQSILIISAIIGRRKTFTYVGLVALFSAAAGLIYGAWIDGAALFSLALYLAGFIAVLAVLLSIASRRSAASSLKEV